MKYTRFLKILIGIYLLVSVAALALYGFQDHVFTRIPTELPLPENWLQLSWVANFLLFAALLYLFPKKAESSSNAPVAFVIGLCLMAFTAGGDVVKAHFKHQIDNFLDMPLADVHMRLQTELAVRMKSEDEAFGSGGDWSEIATKSGLSYKTGILEGDRVNVSFADAEHSKVEVTHLNHDSCVYLASRIQDGEMRTQAADKARDDGWHVWEPQEFRINAQAWINASGSTSEEELRSACEADGQDLIESATVEIDYKKDFKPAARRAI